MITQEQYLRAVHLYETNDMRQKGIRMGQWLMNSLVPSESNPQIFYEPNESKACKMFQEQYCQSMYPNT